MTTSAHALAQLHEAEAEREETERERDINEIHHRELRLTSAADSTFARIRASLGWCVAT
jgi:hypothetical protein